jgi:hypothetical protein
VSDTPYEIIQIGDDDALVLSKLAKDKYCLDIGTNTGKSALALSKTATLVDTCDPLKPNKFVSGFTEAVNSNKINYLNLKWEEIAIKEWDMVFIDHFGDRSNCALAMLSIPSVKMIAIHDTKLLNYRGLSQKFAGWAKTKYATNCGIIVFERGN